MTIRVAIEWYYNKWQVELPGWFSFEIWLENFRKLYGKTAKISAESIS